jgi:hypothetical protein
MADKSYAAAGFNDDGRLVKVAVFNDTDPAEWTAAQNADVAEWGPQGFLAHIVPVEWARRHFGEICEKEAIAEMLNMEDSI